MHPNQFELVDGPLDGTCHEETLPEWLQGARPEFMSIPDHTKHLAHWYALRDDGRYYYARTDDTGKPFRIWFAVFKNGEIIWRPCCSKPYHVFVELEPMLEYLRGAGSLFYVEWLGEEALIKYEQDFNPSWDLQVDENT